MLDAHPLVREYFGDRLKQQNPQGWQAAHKRLYEYYKALPKKFQPDTLQEMEPLFAAVAHGCRAGLHQEAEIDVYWKRIKRGDEHYCTKKLGAFGSDLAEALEIAELGAMKLYLVDYHIESGRLRRAQGRDEDAQDHFKQAAKLIKETGYQRRDEETYPPTPSQREGE